MSSSQSPQIEITDAHAEEFLLALRNTLQNMTKTQRKEVRLVVQNRNAVAISCDKKTYPFLGYSAGRTPVDRRTALPLEGYVIRQLRTWLLARRKSGSRGGRIFITSNRAFTDPEGQPTITLFEWNWPKGDLVEEVLSLLEESVTW